VTRDFGADYKGRRTCGRNSVLRVPGRVLNTWLNTIIEGWVGAGEICFLIIQAYTAGRLGRLICREIKGAERGCIRGLGWSNLK
jgi:hypothetical protein